MRMNALLLRVVSMLSVDSQKESLRAPAIMDLEEMVILAQVTLINKLQMNTLQSVNLYRIKYDNNGIRSFRCTAVTLYYYFRK